MSDGPSRRTKSLSRAATESLNAELESLGHDALDPHGALSDAYDRAALRVLQTAARRLTVAHGMPTEALADALLFRLHAGARAASSRSKPADESPTITLVDAAVDAVGTTRALGLVCELLRLHHVEQSGSIYYAVRSHRRKDTGTYYTPREIARAVVERAMEQLTALPKPPEQWLVCDPALGAGAFLLEFSEALLAHWERGAVASASESARRRRVIVTDVLHGVDRDPLAVAVSELTLWWFIAVPTVSPRSASLNLRVGDSLTGTVMGAAPQGPPTRRRDDERPPRVHPELVFQHDDRPRDVPDLCWGQAFPRVFAAAGFDLVLGNPPWVAYAGRAARPLAATRRKLFRDRFNAWRGYPTLHGLFVERAAQLAPCGIVALLLPSPVADLDGYRAVRRVLCEGHGPVEPLLEFGQDAFRGVVQPCFALIAKPAAARPVESSRDPSASWQLEERTRCAHDARQVSIPGIMGRLLTFPRFPAPTFREFGFQSNRTATLELLSRTGPNERCRYPLLEGRDVHEFYEGEPRLYLDDNPERLKRAGCRLRPREEYQSVGFVVRQTARVPVAALHKGHPFRNSLLAGFPPPEIPPELLVGLLNSSLYRALHLALRRDARQAVFPQVKIAHLRDLPAPPTWGAATQRVAALSLRLSLEGVDAEGRRALDAAVFDAFTASETERHEVLAFLADRDTARDRRSSHP